MPQFPPPSSLFEEGIRLISFCPLCQDKQGAMEVKTLEETEVARLMHLQCQKCQAAVLALVILSPQGLNSVGMITDLTVADAIKFKDMEALEVDDVLELRTELMDKKKVNDLLVILTNHI